MQNLKQAYTTIMDDHFPDDNLPDDNLPDDHLQPGAHPWAGAGPPTLTSE